MAILPRFIVVPCVRKQGSDHRASSALRAMERHEQDRRHSMSHTRDTTLTHT